MLWRRESAGVQARVRTVSKQRPLFAEAHAAETWAANSSNPFTPTPRQTHIAIALSVVTKARRRRAGREKGAGQADVLRGKMTDGLAARQPSPVLQHRPSKSRIPLAQRRQMQR